MYQYISNIQICIALIHTTQNSYRLDLVANFPHAGVISKGRTEVKDDGLVRVM